MLPFPPSSGVKFEAKSSRPPGRRAREFLYRFDRWKEEFACCSDLSERKSLCVCLLFSRLAP